MKALTKTMLIRSMTIATTAIALLLSSAGFAQILESPAERRIQLASPPDVVYLFEQDRKQILDYKKDHIVRVCVSENRHLVPLKVIYDGETASVDSGDCIRIEAKEVDLEPMQALETNWVLRAEVTTMS